MPERFIQHHALRVLPVILAGGSGSRLWPASRSDCPKQFIKLDGDYSLFQKSLIRCQNDRLFSAPIVVVGQSHQHLAQKQLNEIGVIPAAVICEPVGRDTAAAITLAALAAYDARLKNQVIAVFPSDHQIVDQGDFWDAVELGGKIARRSGLLITFGVQPHAPETGYGYIKTGSALHGCLGHMVDRFEEKPSKIRARQFIGSGEYLWNSGMFLFPLDSFFSEMAMHAGDILSSCERAMSACVSDGYSIRPAQEPLLSAPKISIDYALMEKTGYAAVLPFHAGWSDLGTWDAIWNYSDRDKAGNALQGDVQIVGSSNSYGYSTGPLTTLVGVKDVVVVSTKDAVLVAHRDQAAQIKDMVKELKEANRPEAVSYPGEVRPWGAFAPLHNGESHQVKIIEVNPGGQLSLQKHRYRAEHWIIVEGIATVTVDDVCQNLKPGDHAHIPLGAVHRLENFGTEPVKMIEVQTGSYFGEDDIIRLEDVYNREAEPGLQDAV